MSMVKSKLLTTYTPLEITKDSLNEAKRNSEGKIVLKGIMQRADAVNQNGRIYPRHILEREVENYQRIINDNRALGELDHPTESTISLDRVSHIVKEMHWVGNDLCGTIELLNTPKGKIAQALIEDGVKLGISSRGVGSVYKDGDYSVVGEDFLLICLDLVQEPSTTSAFMLAEGLDIDFDREKHLNSTDKVHRLLSSALNRLK